jgi:hypothetical protein
MQKSVKKGRIRNHLANKKINKKSPPSVGKPNPLFAVVGV